MALKVEVAALFSKPRASDFDRLAELYSSRLRHHAPLKHSAFAAETALLTRMEAERGRTAPLLVLLDSRGKSYTSEQFASWLGRERDGGRQEIVFAIGPASGWSEEARNRADLLLSLGPMTLPHELARVVLLEQVYRAFTILAGHPYHCGH